MSRSATPVDAPGAGIRARLHTALDRLRARPTGRMALKVIIGVVGAIVVAAGIALIPLPGPGWALVILGLAIWSIEFIWAKQLLHFTRRNVRKWTRWVALQSLVVRTLLGAVGVCVVAVVVWASLKLTLDIDIVQLGWNYLATR